MSCHHAGKELVWEVIVPVPAALPRASQRGIFQRGAGRGKTIGVVLAMAGPARRAGDIATGIRFMPSTRCCRIWEIRDGSPLKKPCRATFWRNPN